jgi:hypothetical protein
VNGLLVGNGAKQALKQALLTTKRRDYANFHVRAEVKINDKGNSGVWFRLKPDVLEGYEAQINSTGDDPAKTGSLLGKGTDVKSLAIVRTSPVPADTWFTLEVIADGPVITVKVNGTKTAEVKDAVVRKGPIALEAFTDTLVHVRKIEIKELPD